MKRQIDLTSSMIVALWSTTRGTLPAEHPGHKALEALKAGEPLFGDDAKRWALFSIKRLKELRSRLAEKPGRKDIDRDLLEAEEALICMTSQAALNQGGSTRDMIHALLELPRYNDSSWADDCKSAYAVGFDVVEPASPKAELERKDDA